jgi:ABC-2 type transport system ATP-binding protein
VTSLCLVSEAWWDSSDYPHLVPTSERVISIRGLRKSYGRSQVLHGIDLEIERGEIFALLGPNGAGKTTTVEILEGYRERDGGEVSVLGVDPAKATMQWRDSIGIVLQDSADFPDLTVRESITHFRHYYSRPRDLHHVIEAVGLVEKSDQKIRTLSGGQRRRLDLALGIIGSPQLLFLDEPTTGFDPKARRSFWDLIRTLRDQGTTILLTTHYLDEAEALADRVGVIADGRILEISPPTTLGGREKAMATVNWRDHLGSLHRVETDHPTELVSRLMAEFDGEIPSLSVKRPTLEEIYLKMIGEYDSNDPEIEREIEA